MSGLAVAGTRLYFAADLEEIGMSSSSSSSEGAEILGMRCPTEISGLDEIEQSTTLRDGASPSFAVGPHIPAPITIPFVFDPTSRSHQALIRLRDQRRQASFLLAFGRTSPAPTTITAGRIVSAGPTCVEWLGKVLAVSHVVSIGEVVRSTLVLARDGAMVWHFPTPTRD